MQQKDILLRSKAYVERQISPVEYTEQKRLVEPAVIRLPETIKNEWTKKWGRFMNLGF